MSEMLLDTGPAI